MASLIPLEGIPTQQEIYDMTSMVKTKLGQYPLKNNLEEIRWNKMWEKDRAQHQGISSALQGIRRACGTRQTVQSTRRCDLTSDLLSRDVQTKVE